MTEAEIHAEFYNTFVKGSKNGFWFAELQEPLPTNEPEDVQVEHLFNAAVIVDCNEAFARMYGFTSPTELTGSLILKFLAREDMRNLEVIRAFIRSNHKIEKAVTHEADRYGNPRWFLNDAFGKVKNQLLVSICGLQQEITEQKRIELDREALFTKISPRQLMVLQLKSDGYGLKQIAHIMNITHTSAHTHLVRLKKHIGITTDEALLQYAFRLGISMRSGGQFAGTRPFSRKKSRSPQAVAS